MSVTPNFRSNWPIRWLAADWVMPLSAAARLKLWHRARRDKTDATIA